MPLLWYFKFGGSTALQITVQISDFHLKFAGHIRPLLIDTVVEILRTTVEALLDLNFYA